MTSIVSDDDSLPRKGLPKSLPQLLLTRDKNEEAGVLNAIHKV